MAGMVILSGPSCVGKSPLLRALQRFFPALAASLRPLVLYNDRTPRPGELDGEAYHFRPRHTIEILQGQAGYIVLPVRRDLQALEIAQVLAILDEEHIPFFEGNSYMAEALLTAPELLHVPKLAVFLSPLSLEELLFLRSQPDLDVEEAVCDVMRSKLLRRTEKQKGLLSDQDLEDVQARCGAAYQELQYAPQFDWVLPNHDGEDSENWDGVSYPLGDARRCLDDFAAVLQGEEPRYAEKWPGDLFTEEQA